MTMADVAAHEARLRPKAKQPEDAHEGLELELQWKIVDDLRKRRWLVFNDRTDKPTTGTLGRPDLICFGPEGRVMICEVKRKGGKLSHEQVVVQHVLAALGHKHHVIYSFGQYLNIMNGEKL
jgi:hypothetical protein